MVELKTIEVQLIEDGREAVINEDDFDPKIHRKKGEKSSQNDNSKEQRANSYSKPTSKK